MYQEKQETDGFMIPSNISIIPIIRLTTLYQQTIDYKYPAANHQHIYKNTQTYPNTVLCKTELLAIYISNRVQKELFQMLPNKFILVSLEILSFL